MNSPRSIVYGGSGYVPNGSGNQSITNSTGILMTGDESNNESTPFISSTSSSNSNDQQQQNKILIGNIVPISSSSNHAGSMIDHQSGEKRGDQTSQAQVSNIFSPKNVLLFRICFLLFIDVLAYCELTESSYVSILLFKCIYITHVFASCFMCAYLHSYVSSSSS